MASSDMLGQETEMIGLQEALSTLGAGDLALGLRQLVKDSDDAKDAFLEVLSELITSEISEASLSPLPLLDEISDHGLGACDWDRVLTSYENTCPLLLACLRATLAARQGQTEQRKDQGKAEAVKSAVGVILSLIFYMAAPESFQMKNHIDTLVSWLPQWKKQMKGGRITRSAKAPSPRASKTPEQSPTKRRRTARHSSPAAQTFSPKTTTIVSSQSDETFGSSLIENMEMSVTDDDNLEETPEPSLTLLTTLKHDAESGNDLVSFSVKQEPSVDQSESMIEEFVGDLSDDHHEDLYDKTEGNFPDGETPDGNGPDPDGELVEFEESSSQPSKGKGKKCGKKANRVKVESVSEEIALNESETESETAVGIPIPLLPGPLHKYQCHICSALFSRKDNLIRHAKMHEEGPRVRHPCPQPDCDKSYLVIKSLNDHIKTHHEGQKHVCGICKKTYRSQYGLTLHVSQHTGEFRFYCPYCGLGINSTTHYDSHMAMHNGLKKFVCPKCGDRFTHGSSLNAHIKICGTKDKPYACPQCGSHFKATRNLREHILSIHSGRTFKCEICDENFKFRAQLRKHMEKIHTN